MGNGKAAGGPEKEETEEAEMKILVIGSGGREHALLWKIGQSPRVDKMYCAPGNGGISGLAECVDIEVDDVRGLLGFAEKKQIDLTVVGPELPLTLGVVDRFRERGHLIFGPAQKAAELEGSKAFAKDFMMRHHIPTAEYKTFQEKETAFQYLNSIDPPVVLKADGLASGKGVLICQDRTEMFDAFDRIMKRKEFGEAGDRLIIEEFLQGEEASVLAITDGTHLVTLPPAQDHKRIFEMDKGPNTGGMGAYAPAPVVNEKMMEIVTDKILEPVIQGMSQEGRKYTGVLYAGLMITSQGPRVLEFNCRFGDPETQAILPLLDADLVDLMLASIKGDLPDRTIKAGKRAAVCVVMASGGYPGAYRKGMTIQGLDRINPGELVFHAGTKRKDSQIVTSGGRVLGVTAVDETLSLAVEKVYQTVGKITFDGAYYRRDIAFRALKK